MKKLICGLIKIKVLIVSAFVGMARFVQAQAPPVQTIPNAYGVPLDADDILEFVADFANYFFTFAAILMGIIIVWAGIVYMAAGSNTTKVGNAKSILKNGAIGAAIIFAIGLILATIRILVQAPQNFFGQ